jgi:hypothetical protein
MKHGDGRLETPGAWWRGVDDVNDHPVGNPKRRCMSTTTSFLSVRNQGLSIQ